MTAKADILIVDDEEDIRALIKGILEDEGYNVREAAHSAGCYAEIARKMPDLIILDIWLQSSDHDGIAILESVQKNNHGVQVLMISGHGTIETAVSAIKKGAYDFIEKPFKSDRLILMVQRALETAQLRRENESLRIRAEGPTELIGESSAITTIRQMLSRVAQSNSRVLITGEAGTGKDIAARTIHRLSRRKNEPFLTLNCAILRPEHLETELFGSEGHNGKAAQSGVLERANCGTLLLDEVADMPLETQGKIVRVLQEQRFHRVGGKEAIEVDVRIIASTNRDLPQAIAEGKFREDLYYRLNVVPVQMPPLRQHLDDIHDLAVYFIKQYTAQARLPSRDLSEAALVVMQQYNWPGNVRQLRNAIEWALIMGSGNGADMISPEHLPPELSAVHAMTASQETDFLSLPLREAREEFERNYLASQIARFGGNISKTAQFVGMERSALHRKLKLLDISGTDKQDEASEDLPADHRKRA